MATIPTKLSRRVPQQERGERRMAEILDAAAHVIAAAGYQAATMTAIAERAQASIGTVYEYFPNKEAVARALRLQYGDEIEERWKHLDGRAGNLGVEELVDHISSGRALLTANIMVQTIKGLSNLYADAKPKDRPELVNEYKQLLRSYLRDRLAPQS